MGGDYLDLPTIDDDAILSRITIPPNMYATVQSLLKKSERRSIAREDLYGPTVRISAHTRSRLDMPADTGHWQNQAEEPQNSGYHVLQIPTLVPIDQTLPRNEANTHQRVYPTTSGYPREPDFMAQIGSGRPPLPRSAEDQRALSTLRIQL